MELERLMRLSGQNFKMTPINPSTTPNTNAQPQKLIDSNNKIPKSKNIDDIRMDNKSAGIDTDMVASFDDIDDNGITVKAGKTDINGNRVIAKGERLIYTISVDPKTGEPKVDNELKKELIDVDTWKESAISGQEGFLVASSENVYICYEGHNNFVMHEDRSKAAVFDTLVVAEHISDMFTNSTIRKISIKEAAMTKSNCKDCKNEECVCDGDPDAKCTTCEASPCTCTKLKESDGNVHDTDILSDINSRLTNGKSVTIQVKYQNQQFSGWVKRVTQNFLDVVPTQATIDRFQIRDKVVKLPIEASQLFFDPQRNDLIRGNARQVDNVSQQPAVDAPSDQQKPTHMTQQERPPTLTQRVPTGNTSDPSSWKVDLSSKQYSSKPLSEYIQELKESKKEMSTHSAKNSVAKYAHKYNKSVVFDDRKKSSKKGDVKHKKDITGE